MPAYSILNGIGFAKDVRKAVTQSILVNILVSITGALILGFNGFCFGYLVSMFYGYVSINYYYKKRFKLTKIPNNYLFSTKLVVANFTIFVLIVIINNSLAINTYLDILIIGFFLSVIYFLLIISLDIFNKSDFDVLFSNQTK